MTQNEPDIDQTYRTMVIIWLVLLLSQFALIGLAFSFVGPEAVTNTQYGFLGANPPILVGFASLAFTNLVVSFLMRKRAVEQAIAEQNVKHVQTGLVIGCALCESISLLGMVLIIVFAYPFFYLWFALGVFGIIMHFPRRQTLVDASFNSGGS